VQVDVKARLDQRLQVDPSPTHNTVPFQVWPLFDHALQRRHLLRRQPRLRPGMGAVVQTGEALGVVAMNPIAQGLSIHTGMLRRLGTRMPFQHECQGKHPPGGCRIAAALGLPPQLAGTQLQSRDRYGHRPLP
jgi:hypothetical protein